MNLQTPTAILSGSAHPDWLALDHRYTFDLPEVLPALAKLARTLPDAFLVAEAYAELPVLKTYIEAVGKAFCFSLTNVEPTASAVGNVLEQFGDVDGLAWAMSNHDISRLASRWGAGWTRVAAVLLTTLPGACFLYQGEEIGMVDGPGVDPPFDGAGRDAFRHPMQWDAEGKGFTNGRPWLPVADSEVCNVADQLLDRQSLLHLYRRLLQVRRNLVGTLTFRDAAAGVLAYQRGDHLVAINFNDHHSAMPAHSALLLSTDEDTPSDLLPARSAVIALA